MILDYLALLVLSVHGFNQVKYYTSVSCEKIKRL